MFRFRIGTVFIIIALIAVSVGWWADANRRAGVYYLHVFSLHGIDSDKPAKVCSAQISPNRPFSYSFAPFVPENGRISGSLTSGFGDMPELEFSTRSCSFSGQIELGKLYLATVPSNIIDHVFLVTEEADPKMAYRSAESGG